MLLGTNLKEKMVTAEAIKNMFCGYEEKEHSLISIFEYHNAEMKNLLEWGTKKTISQTADMLKNSLEQSSRLPLYNTPS
jgi:integrase/recombinase XerD